MLGLGEVGLIETVVSAFVGVGTILGLAFKAGQWKNDMSSEHGELKDAHEAVHRDVEYLVDEVNGTNTSQRENCPVCSDD